MDELNQWPVQEKMRKKFKKTKMEIRNGHGCGIRWSARKSTVRNVDMVLPFYFRFGDTAGQNEEEEWMDSCWIGLL